MENTPPPSAILETCLSVTNLERSRAFYSQVFGYREMKSDVRFCAFDIGHQQVLILFLQGSDPEGTKLPFGFIPAHGAAGRSHIGFRIPAESLPSWRKHLDQQGVTIESTFEWPLGGVSIYFRDPDGHLLELLTPGVWPSY